MRYLIHSIFFLCILNGCEQSPPPQSPLEFQIGRNDYQIMQDSHLREFIVHVPTTYDSLDATPVVFMLHGSSGNGEKFYNISGWRQIGETEGILTVYPSSGEYCIEEDGLQKQTTKWSVPNRNWTYCRGDAAYDDLSFIREIITLLEASFTIDRRRIYVAGFSNGGKMAAYIATEMSHQIAAVTLNSGAITPDTIFTVIRPMSTLLQYGNREDRFRMINQGAPFPLSQFSEALTNYPPLRDVVMTHINTFSLEPNFTISGDTNQVVTARFKPLNPQANHEFQVRMVRSMDHIYPNGNNHPLHAAQEQWAWFQQFQLD